MTGGLIQLVSYGAQDVYLTSNPQITFFKIVYRRYTHFAMETVRQNLSSTATFSSTCYAPINRVGDLMTKMWLRTTISTSDTIDIVHTDIDTIDYYILGSDVSYFSSESIYNINTDINTTEYFNLHDNLTTIETSLESYIQISKLGHGVICLKGHGNISFNDLSINDVIYITTSIDINSTNFSNEWEGYYKIDSNSDLSNNMIVIKGNAIQIDNILTGMYYDEANNSQEVYIDINETKYYDINSDDVKQIKSNSDPQDIVISTISSGTISIKFNDKNNIVNLKINDIINLYGDITDSYKGYYKIQNINFDLNEIILFGSTSIFISKHTPETIFSTNSNDIIIDVYQNFILNNGKLTINIYNNVYSSVIDLSVIGNGLIQIKVGNGIESSFSEGDIIEVTTTETSPLNDKYFKIISLIQNVDYTVLIIKGPSDTFNSSFDNTINLTSSPSQDIIITLYGNAETFHWVEDIGYALINYVELQIGTNKIDRQYGRFMHIWNQLTGTADHDDSYSNLINCTNGQTSNNLYIPLQFFCCRNNGLAIPLCSLQYHDVRLEIEFNSKVNCVASESNFDNISLSSTTLLVNYIYLDSIERDRFINASHEYLIEQIQHTGYDNISSNTSNEKTNNITLYFNHPIKEFIFCISQQSSINPDTSKNKFINYTDNQIYASGENPVSSAVLQLNGNDRFPEERGKFFNFLQPHMHHSKTPNKGINIYSFCINPQEFQPSGTCNFSRIDTALLKITLSTDPSSLIGTKCYIYGIGYNVLRIMSGMGGLAYSN